MTVYLQQTYTRHIYLVQIRTEYLSLKTSNSTT